MSIRDRITRALRPPAESPAADPRPRVDVAVCDGCGASAERQADGAAPAGWFRRLSGELLCRPCLAPAIEQAARFWNHDAVTRGEHG